MMIKKMTVRMIMIIVIISRRFHPVPSGARTWSDFFIRIMFKSPKVLRGLVFHVLGEYQWTCLGVCRAKFFSKKLRASETEEQMC